jgi:proteasome lid subunit RPN8/RPN11
MKPEDPAWLKRLFLLVFWFFKRIACRIPLVGKKLIRNRQRIFETYIDQLLMFRDESPLDMVSAPPWSLSVSGACLVLGKYVSLQVYNEACSYPWQEVFGFILGRRLGDLFIGITFVPIKNELCSPSKAVPDLYHVMEMKNVVASRFPDLEIISTVHSHPNGVLQYSEKDEICFLTDSHPNIIVSPRRLLWDPPLKRLVAYYHSFGKVRRIKIYEIDKKEP